MTFDDYQQGCLSIEAPVTDEVRNRFINSAAILQKMLEGGEHWEHADRLKKYIFYGRTIDPDGPAGYLFRIHTLDYARRDLMVPTNSMIRMVHAWLGMLSEIPELGEAILKGDLVNVGEESGDFKWYGSVLDDAAGYKSSTVAGANADKLWAGAKARYKDGFSNNAAIHRDTVAERTLLDAQLGSA